VVAGVRGFQPGERGGEPAFGELFAEWRTTAATGRATKAPLASVRELFREAVAGSGDEEGPDFGVTALTIRAEAALRALSHRLETGIPGDTAGDTG